jgi:hypothetical protein
MKLQGEYYKDLLSFDLVKLNLYGTIGFIPVILIYVVPFYLIWDEKLSIDGLKKTGFKKRIS